MNGAIAKLKTGWGKFQKFFRYKHFTHKKSLDSIELSKLKQLTTRCSPYSHLPVEYGPDSIDLSENLTGMGNQNRLIQGLSFKRLKYSPWTTASETVPTSKTGKPRLKVSLRKPRKCSKKADFDQAQLVKCVELVKTSGKEKVAQPRLSTLLTWLNEKSYLSPEEEVSATLRSTRRKSAIWISRRLRVSDKEKLQEIQETTLENSGLGDLSEMRDKEICTSQRELLLQNG